LADLNKLASWIWPRKIEVRKGLLTPVLEISWENGKKVLNAGTVNYSYGSLHDVFRRALYQSGIASRKPQTALILGFGAGSVASILAEELKLAELKMTGVEADPVVIELAKEQFDTSRFRHLQLVNAFAEEFIRQDQNEYDLIAVDVFVEDQIPDACQSEDFFQWLRQRLSSKGLVVFNTMISHGLSGKKRFEEKFMKVFPDAVVMETPSNDASNLVFIAGK
jgi:spermidine synthase